MEHLAFKEIKMTQRTKVIGHLAALITIIIWGTTFISTKLLLVEFSPFEILFFRFTLGYLVLLIMHPHIIKTKNIKEELLFALAGLSGVTLYFLSENIALTYTLTTNVGIIVSIAPFFTAVFAHVFLKDEHIKPQFLMGFALAILGIVLISFNGSYFLKLNPIGDILAVLACIFWAAYSVFLRKIQKLGYHNIGCTRKIFMYGLLFMIPTLPFTEFHLGLERFTNPVHLFNMIFLGIGASALCFVTWNWCVGILGAIKTSAYIYLVPVVTIVSSFLILREKITAPALVGTLLTLVGLLLSEKKPNKKRKGNAPLPILNPQEASE